MGGGKTSRFGGFQALSQFRQTAPLEPPRTPPHAVPSTARSGTRSGVQCHAPLLETHGHNVREFLRGYLWVCINLCICG